MNVPPQPLIEVFHIAPAQPSVQLHIEPAGVRHFVHTAEYAAIACRLVDQAGAAFDARGAALYLRSIGAHDPFYRRGYLNGDPLIEVQLRHEGTQFGRLLLGAGRGDAKYTKLDRDALQRSAESVSHALALAGHFGHRPLSSERTAFLTRAHCRHVLLMTIPTTTSADGDGRSMAMAYQWKPQLAPSPQRYIDIQTRARTGMSGAAINRATGLSEWEAAVEERI